MNADGMILGATMWSVDRPPVYEVRSDGQVLSRQLWLLSTAAPQRQVNELSAQLKRNRLGKVCLKDKRTNVGALALWLSVPAE